MAKKFTEDEIINRYNALLENTRKDFSKLMKSHKAETLDDIKEMYDTVCNIKGFSYKTFRSELYEMLTLIKTLPRDKSDDIIHNEDDYKKKLYKDFAESEREAEESIITEDIQSDEIHYSQSISNHPNNLNITLDEAVNTLRNEGYEINQYTKYSKESSKSKTVANSFSGYILATIKNHSDFVSSGPGYGLMITKAYDSDIYDIIRIGTQYFLKVPNNTISVIGNDLYYTIIKEYIDYTNEMIKQGHIKK